MKKLEMFPTEVDALNLLTEKKTKIEIKINWT